MKSYCCLSSGLISERFNELNKLIASSSEGLLDSSCEHISFMLCIGRSRCSIRLFVSTISFVRYILFKKSVRLEGDTAGHAGMPITSVWKSIRSSSIYIAFLNILAHRSFVRRDIFLCTQMVIILVPLVMKSVTVSFSSSFNEVKIRSLVKLRVRTFCVGSLVFFCVWLLKLGCLSFFQ